MDFTGSVFIVIPGEFTGGMTDRLVVVAPLAQAAVNVLSIRVNCTALGNRPLDPGPDRDLLDVLQHADRDPSGPLEHPEDRGLLLGQCAATTRPSRSAAASRPPFLFTASG